MLPNSISHIGKNQKSFALTQLGFRPFFLVAGIYAVFSVIVWLLVYGFKISIINFAGFPAVTWHAHEMIYGFSAAVVAGFLLTAVGNWTGQPMPKGFPLSALLFLWISARFLLLLDQRWLALAGIFDVGFLLLLSIYTIIPIVRTKQWKQLAIITKLFFLIIGNTFFYLGSLGIIKDGARWGLYLGFYLIIGLILTVGRRVIPFFIERGVSEKTALRNSKLLDILALLSFVIFFVLAVFSDFKKVTASLAGILFIIHSIRFYFWYTKGIWQKPLLWSLYLAYAFIILGFLLFLISGFTQVSPFVPLHAFAYGGIGLITLSMMSRVSLGHTGRDIHKPAKIMTASFVILIVGALIRISFPLFFADHYKLGIIISQVAWIISFGIFLYIYTPILMRPRVDGKPG